MGNVGKSLRWSLIALTLCSKYAPTFNSLYGTYMHFRKLLSKFSWLAVKCVADAAVATSSPVCLGISKPMIAASVCSDHNFLRSAAVRHGMAMGLPSMERYQQSSLHKRRVHVKQCFPTKLTTSKATLPQEGLQMIPSCGQEEMEELNSFETDPTSLETEEQTAHSISSGDTQQYGESVTLSPLPLPRAPSPSSNPYMGVVCDRIHMLPPQAVDEEDSSVDDEEEYTMLIEHGIPSNTLPIPPNDYYRIISHATVGRYPGITRDEAAGEGREEQEDIYPFAWALDGRNMNENVVHSHPRPTTPLV